MQFLHAHQFARMPPSALHGLRGRQLPERESASAAACAPADAHKDQDADQDALDLLARICPPDVPLSQDFVRHVLHAKGMGSPEVHFLRTTG
jgi:hypothetical protein